MPTPPAAIEEPITMDSSFEDSQEPWHPTSASPYPMTPPKTPATTTLKNDTKNAVRDGICGGASREGEVASAG